MTGLIIIHSILRYAVILLTLIVAGQSLMGIFSKGAFKGTNKIAALLMMISCDIQLLVGGALYFMGGYMGGLKDGGMKITYNRFYGLEHPLSMVIAIVLVHLAYMVAKKAMMSGPKFRKMFIYTAIAGLLFLAMTPWPNKKDVGKPYFPGTATIVNEAH